MTGRLVQSTVELAWWRTAAYYAVPWRGRWQTELGGTVLSHAVHVLDMLMQVAGPVRRVGSMLATRLHDIEVEDNAVLVCSMRDGSLATIGVTVASVEEMTRHRFCFENLVAESNRRPYSNSGDPWTFIARDPEHQQRIDQHLTGLCLLPEDFAGQFLRWHQAKKRRSALPVSLQDARQVLELVTAVYHSMASGEFVDLPLSRNHPAYRGWHSSELARAVKIFGSPQLT